MANVLLATAMPTWPLSTSWAMIEKVMRCLLLPPVLRGKNCAWVKRAQDAFAGGSGGKRVGLFLATLELVRQRRVTVAQPEIDSDIELALNEDPTEVLVIDSDEIAHYGEKPAPRAGPSSAPS